MIKAVIFDMDGVIVDSESINITAGTAGYLAFGMKLSRSDQQIILGRNAPDYNQILAKKYRIDIKKLLPIQDQVYRSMLGTAPLVPGIKQLIKRCKKNGYKIGLATSSPRRALKPVLGEYDLYDLFDSFTTYEDCAKHKPDPSVYKIAAKKLGIKPSECIAIEDSGIGVESAKHAGMKCIGFHTPSYKKLGMQFDLSKADIEVSAMSQITPSLIESL